MDPIVIRLAAPLPLLNVWERMHFTARSKFKTALAWEVLAEIGRKPATPIEVADITVWRHSIRAPDGDNLIAKALLDVLQPASKRHPYGLGIIAGDDPAHLVLAVHHVQAATRTEQCTRIRIREAQAMAVAAE